MTHLRKLAALLVLPLLLWPALANHYPLLFPDTLDYLAEGHPLWHALFYTHASFGAMRSAIYPLAIFPFHLNRSPWPILLFHTAIVVYTVYLTTRSFFPERALELTAALLAALSVFTSLSWYITLLMPDILGGPLYLALYLFTFARNTLTKTDQIVLAVIALICATAHPTHLALAAFLCALLWLYVIARKARPSAFAVHNLILVVAAVVQIAVNTRLANHLTVSPARPPYLEARILADGPGATYLREHCPQPNLPALCTHLNNLPANDDEFLWAENGIWPSASPQEQTELRHEELPLVLATLRTYPGAQLAISFHNFTAELFGFGLDDFDNNDYLQQHLNDVLPNARPQYDRTLQSRNAVPWQIPTLLQNITVALSFLFIALTYRRITCSNLKALTTITIAVILANAALTGIFSEVDSRYQSRIIWLLPLLAGYYLIDRRSRTTQTTTDLSSHHTTDLSSRAECSAVEGPASPLAAALPLAPFTSKPALQAPTARSIPAWGKAPCMRRAQNQSAESATYSLPSPPPA